MMGTKKIAKLRKKINSDGYYEKRLHRILGQLKSWHNFLTFNCDPFFVGYEVSRENRKLYDLNYPRLVKKKEWYSRKCGKFHYHNYPYF